MAADQPKTAPGELDLIRGFVNTLDLETREDEIASPAALRAWLAERELLAPRARVVAADVERARAVREALRAQLHANGGIPAAPEATRTLDDAAQRARLELRFGTDGSSALEPAAGGVDGALGRLLAIASAAMLDGSWPRLKACAADNCQWAFYDHSRNHSRVWCSMDVCGNREKVRSYRERS
jgi:predicted RNA-binding Zn ribbon-like protein